MRAKGLHTVCEEAACPNIGECWTQKHATVMILGDTCTRACAFCNVKTGAPLAVDPQEPAHLAEVVATMGLAHVVITSVDRDDLPDGGAFQFVRCIEAIRAAQPGHDDRDPDPRLPAQARCGRGDRRAPGPTSTTTISRPCRASTAPCGPGARYFHSLRLLQQVKELDPTLFTKSGIMVGLGEEKREVLQVMDDMRSADIDFLTIGQYLQPTPRHHQVERFVEPAEFEGYARIGPRQGLPHGLGLAADPLVLPCRRRFRAPARGPQRPARGRCDRSRLRPAMPTHAEKRVLPYRPEQLYELVAGVDRYPEFLPWCKAARITRREGDVFFADLVIAFKVFRERFSSKVTLHPADARSTSNTSTARSAT